jgi:8-oxo-dGTP pyrophosphatase MutT (NUDIX family)
LSDAIAFIMSSDSSFRAFHPSDRFVISCGTVSLDITHRKVLLVRTRSTHEILLPKGRKDENECLKTAAARETYEETGYRATILPLKVPTRATNRTGDGEHTEPIAITQRVTNGVLKIIFWYAASVDSQALPEQGTQQEGEDFDSLWMDCGQALAALTFADDREVAQLAIRAAFGEGYSLEHTAGLQLS